MNERMALLRHFIQKNGHITTVIEAFNAGLIHRQFQQNQNDKRETSAIFMVFDLNTHSDFPLDFTTRI